MHIFVKDKLWRE